MNLYLTKLSTYATYNKYFRWYSNIILRSKDRDLKEYMEKHHILPISFNLGGVTDPNNLAKLTAREHFICHKLICKFICNTEFKVKCYFAYWYLSNRFKNTSSKAYTNLKSQVSSEIGKLMTRLWQTPEYRTKQEIAALTKYATDAYRENNSLRGKIQMSDPIMRTNAIENLKVVHSNIDHTTEEWTSRSLHNPEARVKAKETHQSEAHREKCRQRELNKGIENLSELGNYRQQKLRDKFESEIAFKEYMSSINKGRKKMINILTGDIKMLRPELQTSDWVLYSKCCLKMSV